MTDGAVLVTGATGFIGREIVRRLLSAGRRVIALARPRFGASAADRVHAAVGDLPERARLTVLAHDLGDDLGDQAFVTDEGAWLAATVETVIHAAGDPRFFPDDGGRFRAEHVNGPVALLRALAGGRLARFAHISTAFVCGLRTGRVFEDEGEVGQRFHNPYERVKLEAEGVLRRLAAAQRVDLRVLRPGIVVGEAPATSGGAPSNLFFDFLRLLSSVAALDDIGSQRLRIPGAPDAPFNIVPVEYVAEAAIALADHPDAAQGTFHLVTSSPPTQAEALAMLDGALGLGFACVVDAREPTHDLSPLEERLWHLLAAYGDYLTQDVRFDDRQARRVLDAAGLAPATLTPDYLTRLMRAALATDGASR